MGFFVTVFVARGRFLNFFRELDFTLFFDLLRFVDFFDLDFAIFANRILYIAKIHQLIQMCDGQVEKQIHSSDGFPIFIYPQTYHEW